MYSSRPGINLCGYNYYLKISSSSSSPPPPPAGIGQLQTQLCNLTACGKEKPG